MHLMQGEGELQSGEAVVQRFIAGDKDLAGLLEDTGGTLYLTNRRLVMEKQEPSGKPTVIFGFPQEALRSIGLKGLVAKRLELEVDPSLMSLGTEKERPETKEGYAKLSLKVHDSRAWLDQLTRIIESMRKET